MDIETIKLQGLRWPKGASARIWFCQPRVELTTPAPFRPTATVRSLDILRAVLDRDAQIGAPTGDAPPKLVRFFAHEISINNIVLDGEMPELLRQKAPDLARI